VIYVNSGNFFLIELATVRIPATDAELPRSIGITFHQRVAIDAPAFPKSTVWLRAGVTIEPATGAKLQASNHEFRRRGHPQTGN
jgi:hypothetical protein